VPLPEKPSLQAHEYDPIVLVQSAFTSQGLPSVHSLISIRGQQYVKFNLNVYQLPYIAGQSHLRKTGQCYLVCTQPHSHRQRNQMCCYSFHYDHKHLEMSIHWYLERQKMQNMISQVRHSMAHGCQAWGLFGTEQAIQHCNGCSAIIRLHKCKRKSRKPAAEPGANSVMGSRNGSDHKADCVTE